MDKTLEVCVHSDLTALNQVRGSAFQALRLGVAFSRDTTTPLCKRLPKSPATAPQIQQHMSGGINFLTSFYSLVRALRVPKYQTSFCGENNRSFQDYFNDDDARQPFIQHCDESGVELEKSSLPVSPSSPGHARKCHSKCQAV